MKPLLKTLLVFALLLCAVAAVDAYTVGEIVWVTDPPRFTGRAMVMRVLPNGNYIVNPAYLVPGSLAPWLVEPPSRLSPLS